MVKNGYEYELGYHDAKEGKPKRIAYTTLDPDNPRRYDYIDGYYDGLNENVINLGATYSDGTPVDIHAEQENVSTLLKDVLEGTSTVTDKLNDSVNHPSHYTHGSVECLDAISSALGQDGYSSYLVGNIMKYIWRYKYKNGLEDLKKASFYLDCLIKNEERLVLKTEE